MTDGASSEGIMLGVRVRPGGALAGTGGGADERVLTCRRCPDTCDICCAGIEAFDGTWLLLGPV